MAHILVVDDDAIVRDNLSAYLLDCGYEVTEVSNGEDALAACGRCTPDLVLSDLKMPVMDGLEFLRRFRVESVDIPVIVLSGMGVMEDVVEALRLGASDFLTKPVVNLEVLDLAIKRAVSSAELSRENERIRLELEQSNKELRGSLRALKEDQEAARIVQHRMMPPKSADFDGLHFDHRIFPSLYLSGDFIDYFYLSPRYTGFYLADVSGHGASSALVTVLLKTFMNRMVRLFSMGQQSAILSPDKALGLINQEMMDLGLGKHLAMFYGVIDREENKLCYAMGAHFPPAYLISGEGTIALEGHGLPVGVFQDAVYEQYTVELESTFTLIIMSDGILEVIDGPDVDAKESIFAECLNRDCRHVDRLLETLGVSTGTSLSADDLRDLPDDISILTVSR